MKSKNILLLILLAIVITLISCAASKRNSFISSSDIGTDRCVAKYTEISRQNRVSITLGTTNEFVVTYNEECPLPSKSCTYVSGGYDGGLSCIPIE